MKEISKTSQKGVEGTPFQLKTIPDFLSRYFLIVGVICFIKNLAGPK